MNDRHAVAIGDDELIKAGDALDDRLQLSLHDGVHVGFMDANLRVCSLCFYRLFLLSEVLRLC